MPRLCISRRTCSLYSPTPVSPSADRGCWYRTGLCTGAYRAIHLCSLIWATDRRFDGSRTSILRIRCSQSGWKEQMFLWDVFKFFFSKAFHTFFTKRIWLFMLDNDEHLLYKLWWSKLSPVNAAHMKWGRNNTQKLKNLQHSFLSFLCCHFWAAWLRSFLLFLPS